MRIVVGTGTDAAAVALGDPTLLAGLRGSHGSSFEQQRAAAIASGAMWRGETGSDGAFLVHVFVDEEPPAALSPHLHEPMIVERLRIPSGRLLVAGEEMFSALSIDRYPHMGREVRVPAGDYTMTALRCDAAEHLLDSRFEQQATPQQRRAWARGNALPATCVAGTIAAVITASAAYLRTASLGLASVPLLGAVGLWLWSRHYRKGANYRSAETLYRAIELELPSIVVVLATVRGPNHSWPTGA
jgi:hypothetical protein